MVIHFFRSRQEERIDFVELIDGYFDKLPNSHISSDDQQVKIDMELKEFNFTYSFLITKRSRVSSLYRLSSDYMNINLLIEIPTCLPNYLYRVILQHVAEICDMFKLKIYYDHAENISDFDMFKLMTILKADQDDYYRKNPDVNRYSVQNNRLNEMCQYQAISKELSSSFKTYVKPTLYTPLFDKNLKEVKNAIIWRVGTAAVFPPYLDYVILEEGDGVLALITIDVFEKYASRFLSYVKDSELPIRYLSDKYALRAMKNVNKMRKNLVSLSNFEMLKITDLTEGD